MSATKANKLEDNPTAFQATWNAHKMPALAGLFEEEATLGTASVVWFVAARRSWRCTCPFRKRFTATPRWRMWRSATRARGLDNLNMQHPAFPTTMHLFHIRLGESADAAPLADLAAHTFTETFGADNTPEDLQAHLASAYGAAQQAAELADPLERTLLVFRGEELIGFAQVRRKEFPDCVVAERPVELHRFYLVRSAHGSGAAKPLMQAALAAARELGGAHIWLGVWERNPRAVAFYLKSGFAKIGAHDFVVGSDVQTDWVFMAPLQAADVSAQ